MKTIEQAEKEAYKMLNYEGLRLPQNYEGGGIMNVPYANIPGAIPIDIAIVNANAATRIVLLSGGVDTETTAGVIKNGAFNDKNGDAGLTASTTSPFTLSQFLKMAARNPMKILGIDMDSTVESQRSKKVTIFRQSPFRQLASDIIPLNSTFTNQSQNLKTINLDLRNKNVQIDDQTLIELPISGSSSLELTIWVGDIANIAGAFSQANR
ncbi:hypothetical protein JKY72_01550 [Candidatus Gracilibacteria bacterium]|nr:hypothetical protein [Candidatus Gracilibacteria bacterium]